MCASIPHFFRRVRVLKCRLMEENKIRTYTCLCPLMKHTVTVGIPLCGVSGSSEFTPKAAALGREQKDASPAPVLTRRAAFEKMSAEFGKEAEICISPIISKLQ